MGCYRNGFIMNPSPCPLPAKRGEGGRRPGEGFVLKHYTNQMRFFPIILALTVSAGGGALFAAEPGDAVVVIYNAQLPESKGVADYYAARRHVPENQIIGLKLPTTETMTRGEYRDELENPLLHFLDAEKLLVFEPDAGSANNGARKLKEAKIRYAVLCYGVPLKILEDGSLKEPGEEKLQEALRRNGAAVDSELCLLPWPDSHRMLAAFQRNPFYGATNAASLNPANGLLIVARLDGPDAATAGALVDKAMEAESNGLWGRAYFDLSMTTEAGLKKGDDWIKAAATAAGNYGFETVVDHKPETFSAGFPMSQIALYAGWYEKNASGPFAQPKVEFMPGAFAYHLHSFSAWTLRSTSNYWCGPLLADGATATMGCVYEPFLDGTPNMGIFFTRWLAGFNFGEAAYAANGAVLANDRDWRSALPALRQGSANAARGPDRAPQPIDRVVAFAHRGFAFGPRRVPGQTDSVFARGGCDRPQRRADGKTGRFVPDGRPIRSRHKILATSAETQSQPVAGRPLDAGLGRQSGRVRQGRASPGLV